MRVKTVAFVLGLAALGGLVVLAVAGVTGATAVLVTGAAIVVMIALGNILGGRTTPNRPPLGGGGGGTEAAGTGVDEEGDGPVSPEPGDRRGTMGA